MSGAGHRIVTVGELLWDVLPEGRQLGGAPANFACHAAQLGARAALISRVGEDALGEEALAFLRRRDVDVDHVLRDPDHPTGTVSVELADGGVPIFTIHEDVAWDFIECTAAGLELAATADAFLFGTLAQRSEASRRTIRQLLDATAPSCLRLLDVNFRQHYYDADLLTDALASAGVLKVSEEELLEVGRLTGVPGDTASLPARLTDAFDLTAVAVTRGPDGALLWAGDKEVEHAGFATEIADTVGAGDAFGAALCLGLLRDKSPELIVEEANRLAAWVCSQRGATPKIPNELRENLILTR